MITALGATKPTYPQCPQASSLLAFSPHNSGLGTGEPKSRGLVTGKRKGLVLRVQEGRLYAWAGKEERRSALAGLEEGRQRANLGRDWPRVSYLAGIKKVRRTWITVEKVRSELVLAQARQVRNQVEVHQHRRKKSSGKRRRRLAHPPHD